MKFLTIDVNSKWLDDVQKLGDDSWLTLSFMPAQAFADYAKRKQILALNSDGYVVDMESTSFLEQAHYDNCQNCCRLV